MTEPTKRPLWRCPKCGHRFVTRNLWHSCVRVPISAHFTGKRRARKATFDRWLSAARECGRVTAYAQKTRIIIMARVRFAGVVDDALRTLMREAYRVGTQELTARNSQP